MTYSVVQLCLLCDVMRLSVCVCGFVRSTVGMCAFGDSPFRVLLSLSLSCVCALFVCKCVLSALSCLFYTGSPGLTAQQHLIAFNNQ